MGFAKAVPKLLIGHDGLVLRPPVGVNAAPSPELELVPAFGANAISFRREASRTTSAFALLCRWAGGCSLLRSTTDHFGSLALLGSVLLGRAQTKQFLLHLLDFAGFGCVDGIQETRRAIERPVGVV